MTVADSVVSCSCPGSACAPSASALPGHTQITLTGVYRSPLGPPGDGLDRVLLHQAATAAIGSLLTRLTSAVEDTARTPGNPAAP
ncbi:MAG TPA: hypothetical protein VGF54_09815 [Streptosporangiaceae bacterium]